MGRQAEWRALGTYVQLATASEAALDDAEAIVRALLDRVDAACSRFRDDSDLVRVNRAAGRKVRVDPLLVMAVEVALEVAGHTDGLVTPLAGEAVLRLGYDRTFAEIGAPRVTGIAGTPVDPDAWRSVRVTAGELMIPAGHLLDLGATAKAWAADLAAQTVARELGTGVICSLGGDIAVAPGREPTTWPVEVRERPDSEVVQLVGLRTGGLCTSSTRVRRWRVAGTDVHHVIDPRTGAPAREVWRTVTASGPSAVAANAATTAAIILGDEAPRWLESRGVAARLVTGDGRVVRTPGWPGDTQEGGPDGRTRPVVP